MKRRPSEKVNEFIEEVKHTYKWTVCPNVQEVVKTRVFVTQDNTKWSLNIDLRYIQYRNGTVSFCLRLEDCPQQEVDIKFNLFQYKYDDFQGSQEYSSIFSRQTILCPKQVITHSVPYCDYFKADDTITIYFELIHSKSQPIISQKVGNHLDKDFATLLESNAYSDLKIVVKGTEFMAHKCVLSTRSPVFSAMFSSDMKEKLENRVEINDIDADVFEQFLKFIYTGIAPKIDEMSEELLVCSEFYGVSDLKNICEETLCQRIGIESAIDLLLFAVKYRAEGLKERTIDFIAENYLSIENKCSNSLSNLYKNETKIIETIVSRMARLVVKQTNKELF